jgi:hypothetical protein
MFINIFLKALVAGCVVSAALADSLPFTETRAFSSAEQRFVARKDAIRAYAYQLAELLTYGFGTYDMPLGESWRTAGSRAEHEASKFIKQEMRNIGLAEVAREGFPVHGYTFKGASVQVVSPTPDAAMLAGGLGGVIGTGPEGLAAELVYVGLGTQDDYLGKDVKGKIVLVDVSTADMNWFHVPHYEAELHGASGMIVHWLDYQSLEGSIYTADALAKPGIPAVVVSHKDFAVLKSLATGSPSPSVMVRSDVKIDTNATSFNVIGYIPGNRHSDQLIVLGSHYDKWWYGAIDNGGGVAQMLAVAKAMIDSGYQPDRTIVFVAHGAEEYGWTNTSFDWALGSWSNIYLNHPDWATRTVAYFNMDDMGGGLDEDTLLAQGTPETQGFREDLIQALDSYFTSTAPWSSYYRKASTQYGLPSTWVDEFSYGVAGIPVMSIFGASAVLADPEDNHTQMDTMAGISPDNLAMGAIANGLAIMSLDRSRILPYGFAVWGDDLAAHLDNKALPRLGVDLEPLYDQLSAFQAKADRVSRLAEEKVDAAIVDAVNDKLLQAQKSLASGLIRVGGYEQALYPHEQYQNDGDALRRAINLLEFGKATRSASVLRDIYGMWEGALISKPVYLETVINRHDPGRADLFWATGILAHYTDAYDEYFALLRNKRDVDAELAALQTKLAIAQSRLSASITNITLTLSQAMDSLKEAENLLD